MRARRSAASAQQRFPALYRRIYAHRTWDDRERGVNADFSQLPTLRFNGACERKDGQPAFFFAACATPMGVFFFSFRASSAR